MRRLQLAPKRARPPAADERFPKRPRRPIRMLLEKIWMLLPLRAAKLFPLELIPALRTARLAQPAQVVLAEGAMQIDETGIRLARRHRHRQTLLQSPVGLTL